jgi:hypothetical protein
MAFAILESVGVHATLKRFEALQGVGQGVGSALGILFGLLRAADPQQPIALRLRWPPGQEVAVDLGVGVSVVSTGEQVIPGDLALLDGLTKEPILFPGPGHHTDETASVAIDAAKVFQGGQHAIGHIDEVGSLEQLAQATMVLGVETIVGLITVIDLVHQRN